MKTSKIYHEAGITKQGFSKILCDKYYQPKKNTVLAFCAVLNLDYDQSVDLLSRAGFSFSRGSRRDLIIEYFFKHGETDLGTIHNYLVAQNYEGLYRAPK